MEWNIFRYASFGITTLLLFCLTSALPEQISLTHLFVLIYLTGLVLVKQLFFSVLVAGGGYPPRRFVAR